MTRNGFFNALVAKAWISREYRQKRVSDTKDIRLPTWTKKKNMIWTFFRKRLKKCEFFFIRLKHINKWQLKDFKIIFHKWSNHSNGRKVTKTPVNLYNPTLLLSGSCMVRDILIHWKSSLWPYLAVLLVKSLICTIYNFCWSWFKKRFIVDSSHHCESGQLETVTHILRDYVLYPT